MIFSPTMRHDRVYVAFHKGDRSEISEKAMSGIIKLFTNKDFRDGRDLGINLNRYSHTEVIFPTYISGFQNSYSSRGTAHPSGVSFRSIDYNRHPDRWDIIEATWLRREADQINAVSIAKRFVGCKYAYNNVFNTFGFIRTKRDRRGVTDWWCSEIDAYVIGIPDYKISPNKLFTEVVLRNQAFLEADRDK